MNKDKIIEKTMSKLKDQLLNLTQNPSDNIYKTNKYNST